MATFQQLAAKDLTPERLWDFYHVRPEQVPADRPYTWLMIVMGLNGIAAFREPGYMSGSVVAMGIDPEHFARLEPALQQKIREGADADWYALNFLWGVPADAVFCGANILRDQPGKEWYPAKAFGEVFSRFRREKGWEQEPHRVLLSGSGDLKVEEPVFRPGKGYKTIVFTTDKGGELLSGRLNELYGNKVGQAAEVRALGERVELAEVMRVLRQDYGVRYLDVQGGPKTAGDLLHAGLVDEFRLTIAPQLSYTYTTRGERRSAVVETAPGMTPFPEARLYLAVADKMGEIEAGNHKILRLRMAYPGL